MLHCTILSPERYCGRPVPPMQFQRPSLLCGLPASERHRKFGSFRFLLLLHSASARFVFGRATVAKSPDREIREKMSPGQSRMPCGGFDRLLHQMWSGLKCRREIPAWECNFSNPGPKFTEIFPPGTGRHDAERRLGLGRMSIVPRYLPSYVVCICTSYCT